uniref:Plastid lipid-associated protein/fibrillin conserved domain-containing protein n=1 Tax=Opuntia streptacantha TaxID=393608 RepID=A0A7C9DND4_OPUST
MALPACSLSKSLPVSARDSIPLSFPSSPSSLHFPSKPIHQIPHKLSISEQSTRISSKTRVSFFPAFLTQRKDAKAIKEELLQAIEPLDRGADATPEDQQRIDQLTRKLEAVNPTKEPLKSDLLNGKWELIYTTSKSILQTERPKFLRSRVNYQAINLDTLRAQNMETWPFFNQIPVKAPETARGSLEITYLDEDLRVSRGDKGNLFILKIVDRSYRIATKKT